MAGNKKRWTRKKIMQFAGLFLFLVALPAGSWYYLKKGLDYRLAALEELGDHGKIPAFSLQTADGRIVSDADLQGRITIAGFLSLRNEELSAAFGENLRKLHLQFDERPDVLLLNIVVDSSEFPSDEISRFAAKYELTDTAQCLFPGGDPSGVEKSTFEGFRLSLPEDIPLEESPYLMLVDTNRTIRRYYNVTRPEEVKRLVEHLAIILPQIKERDLIFQREREK
jgi:hypothetical protein